MLPVAQDSPGPHPVQATRPGGVDPVIRVTRILGAMIVAGALVAVLPGLDNEDRDWLGWVVGFVLAVGAALLPNGRRSRVVGGVLVALVAFGVLGLLVVDAWRIADVKTAVRSGVKAGVLPWTVAPIVVASGLIAAFARPLPRRLGPWGWGEGERRVAFGFVAALAVVTITPIYLERRLIDPVWASVALVVAGLVTWIGWWDADPSPAWRWWHPIADVALLGLVTIAAFAPQVHALVTTHLHHWSFFVGPVAWAKHGRLLLWEIPSQYGWLSILFPSAIPVSDPWVAFHVALALGLAATCVVAWLGLRRSTPTPMGRLWLLLALALGVYLFPGARGGPLGTWGYPSSSAYRFVWVIAIAIQLVPRSGRTRRRQAAWTTAIVAGGVLWSVESAAWVVATAGFVALVEAVLRWARGERGDGLRAWLRAWAAPLLSPVACVLGVAVYDRVRYGIVPDVHAWTEFATSYANGLWSMPIEPSAGILAVALCIAVALAFGVDVVQRTRDPGDAGLLAPFAAMAATGTYFVSRSHDSNAANLVAFWVLLLAMLLGVARQRQLRAWAGVLRATVVPVTVVMAVVCFGPPRDWRALATRLQRAPAHSVADAVDARRLPVARLPEVARAAASLPLVNLTTKQPTLAFGSVAYEPFLPVYPWEEFKLLTPERQTLYLERFALRGLAKDGLVVRQPGDRQRLRAVDVFLRRYYELVTTRALAGGFVLERWRRR